MIDIKKYDIYIDTEAITIGIRSINKTIDNIELLIKAIQHKIIHAHSEFDSINYQRASSSINQVTRSLEEMNERLSYTKKYLDKITDIIERYNSIKF